MTIHRINAALFGLVLMLSLFIAVTWKPYAMTQETRLALTRAAVERYQRACYTGDQDAQDRALRALLTLQERSEGR